MLSHAAAILRLRLTVLLCLALLFGFGKLSAAQASGGFPPLARIEQSALPPEAQRTLERIRRGGPFPYPHKDGSVFGNFEKRLPAQARGYYREYTVPTPGSRDRGARRLIAGTGKSGNVATSGEYYYSPDHYRSFFRIREP